MISDVLRDIARALWRFDVGSTAIDGTTDFFGGLTRQVARAISTVFGS